MSEFPMLDRIRAEAGWNELDGEPMDSEALERYLTALESYVRAFDMLRGEYDWSKPPAGFPR